MIAASILIFFCLGLPSLWFCCDDNPRTDCEDDLNDELPTIMRAILSGIGLALPALLMCDAMKFINLHCGK